MPTREDHAPAPIEVELALTPDERRRLGRQAGLQGVPVDKLARDYVADSLALQLFTASPIRLVRSNE